MLLKPKEYERAEQIAEVRASLRHQTTWISILWCEAVWKRLGTDFIQSGWAPGGKQYFSVHFVFFDDFHVFFIAFLESSWFFLGFCTIFGFRAGNLLVSSWYVSDFRRFRPDLPCHSAFPNLYLTLPVPYPGPQGDENLTFTLSYPGPQGD